jgi:predicted ArsR family transcriptional regulator
MKQKKETLASKALDLVKQNPNIKPKEMAEKLGVTVQRVYVLRNNLKKKLTKKVVSNVTTKRKGRPTKVEQSDRQYISRPANYYQNLEHENRKLTEWTLMWKQKYEKLEQDYTQAKVMYLNSQAVIDYLENKVANLITISNLKGN